MIAQAKCSKCNKGFTDDLWCDQYCQQCWERFSAEVWSTVMEQLKGLVEKPNELVH